MLPSHLNLANEKCKLPFYFFLLFLLLLDSSSAVCVQSGEIYIYGFPNISENILKYFNQKNWRIIFYDLNRSASSERFLQLMETLMVSGVSVISPRLCISCLLGKLSWKEIMIIYASPLIGVFRNGELTAITIGITDYKTLDQASTININDAVRIFTPHKVYDISDEAAIAQLEKLLRMRERSIKTEMNVLNIVLPIILLGLADSINPCTFIVFTALLFIALHSFGKKKAATTGFSFILSIFIGYCALGLGLFQILIVIPNINKAIALVGLVIGFLSIINGLKPRFKSPIPRSVRRFLEIQINKSHANPIASFVLGLFATLTLLPCSSSPYMIGLGLLSTLKETYQAYLLLILYNVMFVSPLFIILVVVLASTSLAKRIKSFRSKGISVMEIINGALLMAVCIYLLIALNDFQFI